LPRFARNDRGYQSYFCGSLYLFFFNNARLLGPWAVRIFSHQFPPDSLHGVRRACAFIFRYPQPVVGLGGAGALRVLVNNCLEFLAGLSVISLIEVNLGDAEQELGHELFRGQETY